jgi:hypothetical protein
MRMLRFVRVKQPPDCLGSVPNLPTQSAPGAPTFEDEEALEDEEGDVRTKINISASSSLCAAPYVAHVRCIGG